MSDHVTPDQRRRLPRYERDLPHATAYAPDEPTCRPLDELLVAWREASSRLLDAVHVAQPPAVPVATDALLVLSNARAAAEALVRSRWATVRDALRYGAEVRAVGRALGLDDEEVRVGLRSWADRQLEHAGMSAEDHADALALVAENGGAR